MPINFVIGVDPSGNFYEGKGVTGLAVYDREHDKVVWTGCVRSETYGTQVEYWRGIIRTLQLLLQKYSTAVLSVEDYLLYHNKARNQINSKFETPQLIGVIKYTFYNTCDIYMRPASAVKTRWHDNILLTKGYLKHNNHFGFYILNDEGDTTPVIEHARDAIRHAIHCGKFEIK